MLTPTEGRERSFASNFILAVVLPCVAGMVNASGFFAVGAYTSHVTGNISMAGDELAQGKAEGAIAAFALVAFFIAGAVTAAAMVQGADRRRKARYAATLLLEAGVLVAFTAVSAWVTAPPYILQLYLTAILCFAMGMQNALVTRISGAVIRTTHMTGVATDIGLELVSVASWFQSKARGKTFGQRLRLILELPRNPEASKLSLHLLLFLSFVGGAIAGPMLYLRHRQLAMLLPAGIIVALVGLDLLVTVVQRRRGDPYAAEETKDVGATGPRPVDPVAGGQREADVEAASTVPTGEADVGSVPLVAADVETVPPAAARTVVVPTGSDGLAVVVPTGADGLAVVSGGGRGDGGIVAPGASRDSASTDVDASAADPAVRRG